MNKIMKIICLLLVFAMASVFLLSGCGSTAAKNETGASSNTTAAVSTAAGTTAAQETKPLDPVTLRWILPKIQAQNDPGPVFDAANKVFKEKLNATVKFDPFEWADFEKKISLLIAAGEEADIFFTASWINNYYQNIAKDGLTDITTMLETVTPALKAKFSDGIWDALKVNGKIYAVPNQSVWVRRLGFQFRKDLVDKYSFDYPSVKKLEDLEPYLKTIKGKEADSFAIENVKSPNGSSLYENAQNYFGWNTFVSMKTPGVGLDFDTNLKVVNQFETQTFKDFIKMAHGWYLNGYTPKDSGTLVDPSPYRQSAKYAVVSEPAAYPGQDVVFSSSQAGGTQYVLNSTIDGDSVLSTASVASNLNSVCKTSSNPERALMALELINTDKELYNTLCWGLEGTNYTKQADGTIEQMKNGQYEGVYNFFLGDMLQTYVTKGQPLDMYDQIKKLNDSGKPSAFIGFNFISDPVKAQIAQCSAVTDQFLAGLCTGYLDPDKYYTQFMTKLKAAGADAIIAEMQKQVDEWAKTK